MLRIILYAMFLRNNIISRERMVKRRETWKATVCGIYDTNKFDHNWIMTLIICRGHKFTQINNIVAIDLRAPYNFFDDQLV